MHAACCTCASGALLHAAAVVQRISRAAHLLLVGLPHLGDAGGLDEVGQRKGGFLYATLALQELAFLGPVPRHRHCVAVRLQHRAGSSGERTGLQGLDTVCSWRLGLACERN